jgi:hypothetical protein
MIIDRDLMFSNAQAVAADGASTDIIDLAPLGIALSAGGFPTNLGRNLGFGEELYIWVSVDVASAGGATSVNLQTDADVAFGSPVAIVTGLIVIPISTPAGTRYFVRLPIAPEATPYERYIRLFYDVTAATVTLSAGIIKDTDSMMPSGSYVGGYTNAAG